MKKIIISALSFTLALSLCSCGTEKESSVPETTTATEETTETTTQEVIKVGEGTAYNIVTTKQGGAESSTEASSDGQETSQATMPAPSDVSDSNIFTSEDAMNLLEKGYSSLVNQNFDDMLVYTNMGDICRIEDSSMTDDVILQELKSGKYDSQLAELGSSAAQVGEFKREDYSSPVYMTSSEVTAINDCLAQFAEISSKNFPHYTQGYKIGFANNTSDIGHLYVLCNDSGIWKFDICFGVMCEGLNALADYASDYVNN